MSNEKTKTIDATLMQLSRMRRQVELEKAELNKLQGRRSALEDRLRNEFSIRGGVEEARKRIKALDDQLTRRNKAITEEIETLRGKYDFGEI